MISSGRFPLRYEQGEAIIFHRAFLICVNVGIDRKRDLIQDYQKIWFEKVNIQML